MRRLPVAAFVALAVATVAAFFVVQHLKVATPLLAGFPAPHPAEINPAGGRTCKGVSHRRMLVSFYLLHRSDNVDVDIVDADGDLVDTLASNVYMPAGAHPQRRKFIWNGRTTNGGLAADGSYYIKVVLLHQGRYVLISNNSGPEPITVETVGPQPRITSVQPALIPRSGTRAATITYSGNGGEAGRILVYRTDLPGGPRLVKTFAARRGTRSLWDGRIRDRPAPQGTYLIGFTVTDKACNTGRFPAELPPASGTTVGAGLTIRYLAAEPPLTPVTAGQRATVFVDARGNAYRWTLRRAGGAHALATGSTHAYELHVRLPGGHAGLYELSLGYRGHRTSVPVVAGAPTSARPPVLVVMPALTWQGSNPVDDNGDGLPNTLTAGGSILLARPLVHGIPAGFSDLIGLLAYLQRHHLSYGLTTDLALAQGVGPALGGYRGLILAGAEPWVPSSLSAALRSYAAAGGHVLSLGLASLNRGVSLTATRAYNPTGPRVADIFGARFGPVVSTRGALILAGSDGLGLFNGTSGTFRYRLYQPFTGLTTPLKVASSAGVGASSSAVIGFDLGRGAVIEAGLPGFGSRLAHDLDSQELMTRMYRVLAR